MLSRTAECTVTGPHSLWVSKELVQYYSLQSTSGKTCLLLVRHRHLHILAARVHAVSVIGKTRSSMEYMGIWLASLPATHTAHTVISITK